VDAGEDAGTDAGEPDAGDDAGSDGGTDAGPDAGAADGGLDAGDPGVCAMASWTSSGFDRFVAPYEVDGERRLVNLSPRGVLLARDGGLELRSGLTGTLLQSVDAVVSRGAIAVSEDAGVQLLLDDGTLATWSAAGLVPVLALGGAGVLALDVRGSLYAWQADAGVLTRVSDDGDGGQVVEIVRVDAGPSLVTTNSTAVLGGQLLVHWLADGGAAILDRPWRSDAGVPLEALPRAVFASPDTIVAFARRCASPVMSCMPTDEETWVRVTDLLTGIVRWEAKVLPAGVTSRLEEAALVSLPASPGAVAALVQADFSALDAGYGLGAYL
jgi:hypothetical protein